MSRQPRSIDPVPVQDDVPCHQHATCHVSQNTPGFGSCVHVAKPGTSQVRLEHESPLAGLPPVTNSDTEGTEDDEPGFHQGPHGPPAFLQRLIDRFSRLGMNVHDADFEIPLRTWYIDHVNMRRCTAFRILQLVGPPRFWEQQFSSLWVDLISQEDWFDLTFVQPDPPRPPRHSFVRLDVIITQSLHMDRFPGLVTVMPTTAGYFDMYAVAFSFSDFVSGHDIIEAADAAHLCRYHPCTVTFGWDDIPHTLQPQHVMRPGDGFQVAVRQNPVQPDRIAEPSSSSSQVRNAANSSMPSFISNTPETPWWDDPVHGRFTTPLHLFQLDAHEVTVQLVNAQLAQPSHEISAATGVPFDCLEAIHMVIDRPYEFPEMAIPAILQRTGDIPPRSTDRLMLIDVVYFHHPAMATAPDRPTVVRTVHKVDYQVIRPQLLMTAAVYHYCTFLQDTCEVFLDRIPWPLADRAPRPIRHGSYARILAPPPQGYEVDTMQAAEVLHADAETNAMMEFLQEDLPLDDATFLQQITAQRTFAQVSMPRIRRILAPLQMPVMRQHAPDEGHSVPVPAMNNALQNDCVLLNRSCLVTEHQTDTPPQPLQMTAAVQAKPASQSPTWQIGTQFTLHKFFTKAPEQSCESSISSPQLRKCSETQQQEPPSFTTAALPVLPNVPQARPRPIWHLELDALFEEATRTARHGHDPTMVVSVWYIHHVRHPTCMAPRMVELDNIHELWYADLCNAWWDRIVQQQPMRVLIVKPTPDDQLNPTAQTHIILEQAFSPDKAALVFTAVFLANFRNGVMQRAESVDIQISAQYMIDKHRLNEFCDYRPCVLTSGIMRFHRHVREEIFSGISVHLVVGPCPVDEDMPHSSTAASSNAEHSHRDESDHTSLMQHVRRWTRNRQQTPQNPAAPNAASTTSHAQAVHFPSVHVSDLREFRSTLQWALQQDPTQHCLADHQAPQQIQSWFLDSFRVTRASTPRTILLRPWPHTWIPDILARWQDTIDPHKPVFLHVVQPMPTESTPAIRAHVLVVQTPNPLWRAALLSIVHFDHDPWNPSHLAVMLDVETTVEQLSFIAHINHPANPMADHQQIEARHASIVLDSRSPFHVRNGYHFDIIVFDTPDAWDDAHALIQLWFSTVKAMMRQLQHHVVLSGRQCMIGQVDPPHQSLVPMSLTQDPRQSPTTNAWESLPFHGYLQALWQPLSLLSPDSERPTLTVVTWYLDHIRYPQAFQSREVRLTGDPTGWIRQLRRPWFDVILPLDMLYFHIVQPAPPNMEPDVAAHILLVQQPVEGFRSTLITLFDSAFIGAQADRYASMAPTPLAFSTLIGLTYRDLDCQQRETVCDAWVGREELLPQDTRPIIDGHSLAVAVHRHLPVGGEQDDPWQQNLPRSGSPSPEAKKHRHDRTKPNSPVKISLHASILDQDSAQGTFQDDTSTLLWSVQTEWKHTVAQSLANFLRPVPQAVQLPLPTCQGILASACADFNPDDTPHYELYIDGATGARHAGWALVAGRQSSGNPPTARSHRWHGCLGTLRPRMGWRRPARQHRCRAYSLACCPCLRFTTRHTASVLHPSGPPSQPYPCSAGNHNRGAPPTCPALPTCWYMEPI